MPRTATERQKAYVRASAEFQFACTVRILRPAAADFDEMTGRYTPSSSEIYEGPARIWDVDEAGVVPVGDGTYAMMASNCSIPWDYVPVPRKDDLVEVVACPGDVSLEGKTFQVQGVNGGGQMRATRRMRITRMAESGIRD